MESIRLLADYFSDIDSQLLAICTTKSAHDCLFSPQHMTSTYNVPIIFPLYWSNLSIENRNQHFNQYTYLQAVCPPLQLTSP